MEPSWVGRKWRMSRWGKSTLGKGMPRGHVGRRSSNRSRDVWASIGLRLDATACVYWHLVFGLCEESIGIFLLHFARIFFSKWSDCYR